MNCIEIVELQENCNAYVLIMDMMNASDLRWYKDDHEAKMLYPSDYTVQHIFRQIA
jgi:hypothetical protein